MQKIDNNMQAYLHSYEAYRVPKGTTVKDAAGKDVVLSKEEDVLVLTEKASKQLIEDRRDYGGDASDQGRNGSTEDPRRGYEANDERPGKGTGGFSEYVQRRCGAGYR